MPETIKLIVEGKVQGVFYRHSTKEKATELGITGTVRNLKNGNVEIIATGTAEQLAQLTQWCYHGPPHAIVNNISSTPLSLQTFNNFIIIRF
ncbi:MAG: acylphosphatase [Bacteroidota bacterium]